MKATTRKSDALARYQDAARSTRDKLAVTATLPEGPQKRQRQNAAATKSAAARKTYQRALTSGNDAIRRALAKK